MKTSHLLVFFLVTAICIPQAQAQTVVAPGNRHLEQPAVPGASSRRTKAGNSTFDAKYRKVYALLQHDQELRSKIRAVADAYGIEPIHIAGAIVGVVTERIMHGEEGHEHEAGDELHWRDDHDHTGPDDGHDHTYHEHSDRRRDDSSL